MNSRTDNKHKVLGLNHLPEQKGPQKTPHRLTTSNLDVQYENLAAAKSRISDADIAFESAEMASAQILNNASVAVLSHANQNGAEALRLLQ